MTENKMLFAIGQDNEGVPVLVIGLSDDAWDHMKKDHLTHTLDLAKLDIPLKIIMFGGGTYEDCKTLIEVTNMEKIDSDTKIIDMTDKDFGID